jgi:hypothetical protein
MSDDAVTDSPAPGMVECAVCELDVPAGEFCGYCGSHLTEHRHKGPRWLRMKSFSASSGEHLLTPNVVSSLFPHLPAGSRMSFLLGLCLIVAALIAATMFRLPGALITIAALGLPLLFLYYLQEADVFRDVPPSTLVGTAALGIGIGVAWVLLTGAAVARSYGMPLGAALTGTRILRDGLCIPLGGMILMLVPAVLMRLRRRGTQESLDGFAIGALGALMFTAAATLTRLAPQFTAGMIAKSRPMEGLIVEAGIRGIAVPLTAASVGGLVGAALWFTRSATKVNQDRNYVRLVLVVIALAVLALYAGVGLIDVARIPQIMQLVVHLTLTAVALFALRVGLHLALLHEGNDEVHTDEPLLCSECGHVVPDMPFCVACGTSTRAASRSSRLARRDSRPVRTDVDPEPAAGE